MARLTLRPLFAVSLVLVAGCGPDPEPTTAAAPPPAPTVTATAVAPTPPPAEPTGDQRREAARAALAAKDYGRAKTELDALLTKNPNDVEALKMLSEVFAGQNDNAGATDALFRAAKADGGKDEVLALGAAKALYDVRRYDDAIAVTQMATKTNDKSIPAWMYMGLAQTAKEDYAAAAETYGKLATALPDEPRIHADLALAQASAGKNDDAKKSAKTALDKWTEARSPKSQKEIKYGKGADEIARIARAYRRAGDAKGAEATLGKYTVPKDETAPILDVERGLARVANKDSKGAAAASTKAKASAGEGFAPAHLVDAGAAALAKKPDDMKTHLAAYEKGATPEFAWERKWIETLATGGESKPAPDAKKPAADPKKAVPVTPKK